MKITGQQQIADLFGVTRESIDTWQKQGFPVAVRGGPGVPSEYDSEACITWLVDREVKKVREDRPQDRLARAQAEKIEMENEERRGNLVLVEVIEPMMRDAFRAARTYWRNEPARLAREVAGKSADEIEALLMTAFDAFLVRLSRWSPSSVIEDDDSAAG